MNRHGKNGREIEADRVRDIYKCTLLIHILITIISIHAHHIENICLHTNALPCISICRIKHPNYYYIRKRSEGATKWWDRKTKCVLLLYLVYTVKYLKPQHTTTPCVPHTLPIQIQITHLLHLSATKFSLSFSILVYSFFSLRRVNRR